MDFDFDALLAIIGPILAVAIGAALIKKAIGLAITLIAIGADVLGINCRPGPAELRGLAARMLTVTDKPIRVQANAGFFLRRESSGKALRMAARDQIHLLGSDCHNLTDRTPNLGSAVERIRQELGEEALQRISGWQEQALYRY